YNSGATVLSKKTFVASLSELKPEPKILTISPGESAPGTKLPAFTTAVTAGTVDVVTRAEFGSAMSDDSSTASKSEPCSCEISCSASLSQRSSGAPDRNQEEPLS